MYLYNVDMYVIFISELLITVCDNIALKIKRAQRAMYNQRTRIYRTSSNAHVRIYVYSYRGARTSEPAGLYIHGARGLWWDVLLVIYAVETTSIRAQ